MTFPTTAQGIPRSLPDGFLHLNNYAHSMKSGMAGVIYERVFTKKQQDTLCQLLRELADVEKQRNADGRSLYHFKHNVYRFDKAFLNANFKRMVYGQMNLLRQNPSGLIAFEVTKEVTKVLKETGIPKLRFK